MGDPAADRSPLGRRRLTPRRRFVFSVLTPIFLSVFSQFEFVQSSGCSIAKLPWDIGACEVMADLIAPAWALAIFPIASRLRKAATKYGSPAPESSDSWLATRLATVKWAQRSATGAKWGALLIILLAYTREWERFGQRPDIVWYVVVIVATLAMLAVPLWWIRDELHRRGTSHLSVGRFPAWANRYLMDDSNDAPRRAPHVLAFSGITLVVALTVLGQLDSLLRGMHPAGKPPVGIGGLASLAEFDLSRKPAAVIERVKSWREYTEAVGAQFGSAYDVVTAHAIFDTFATIPAYVAIGFTLAAYAWSQRLTYDSGSGVRRAFELITLSGLFVLVITAVVDIGKNFLTWYVMDRAWSDPASLTDANVRLLWFFSLVRSLGLITLAAASLLILAIWDTPTRRLRRALVAVRSEVLLLAVFGLVVLQLPQTADVIRGWHVSHTLIAIGLATVLSMLLRWTSVTNLRLQHSHMLQVDAGEVPVPPRVEFAYGNGAPTAGRFAAAGLLVVAVAQMALSGLGVNAGRGLIVPAALVVVFWLFGLALPIAPYVRGDRAVTAQTRRRLPRMLGATVYLVIGIATVKAAAASVAYARKEDWWLFFALVPPLIGVWRVATRTTATMGRLEAAFAAIVAIVAAVLLALGNPELSPTALAFTGITFSYGSLAYFNSYERESMVNRISRRYLSPARAKPFVFAAATAVGLTVLWFYVDPIAVGPRIGTIGMIILAMMALTLIGAGAVRFAELTRPPRILAAFGVKRTPVFVLIGLWLLIAPAVVDQRVNNVRILPETRTPTAQPGFEDVWNRWGDNNLSVETSAAAATAGREVIPLLLISSSGGGLRAAAWTSFVLDCLFEGAPEGDEPCTGERETPVPLGRVGLVSSVSGGSLGVAAYFAHVLDSVEGSSGLNSWVDEVLGDDFLAAPIGWLFFVDLPRSLIGFGTGISNRAELMERVWEESWPQDVPGIRRGIREVWAAEPAMPPVVFNATSVNDGCRFNISVLNADGVADEVPSCTGSSGSSGGGGVLGATHDLVDLLCPEDDVALSTAAGMSARFPVVAVAARVASDSSRDCAGTGVVFAADGGYIEGSGAGTLLDGWQALSDPVERFNTTSETACVVPFMVHIDNGYESPTVSGNAAVPREFLVPLMAVANSSSGITEARAEAALAFEHPFTIAGRDVDIVRVTANGRESVTSRYTRLVTRAHPGVQAPLGWTLSQASIDDLRSQLAIMENGRAFAESRSWLDGQMFCASG